MARWVGFILCFAAAGIASAAEVVWLDGRRETVRRIVVKKDAVLVSFDKGLRSVSKRRLIKAIDDEGNEIAVGRRLVDKPPS